MARLKKRVLTNAVYQNTIISADGRFTTIIIQTHSHSSIGQDTDWLQGFDEADGHKTSAESSVRPQRPVYLTDKENSEVVMAVQQIVGKYRSRDLPIWVAGSPSVTHFLKQSLMHDVRKFLLMATATVSLVLFVMFRRISGVLLPLLVVFLSLLTTIGLMASVGVAIKVPTQILPSFLLAVGVGTSVHILAIFFFHYRKSGDKEEAIAYALQHSGLAVVMTNVTNASGLISFSTAEVAPIADLGIFAGIGVMLTFIYTIVLLPALLAIIPIPHRVLPEEKENKGFMRRFLASVAHFSTGHPLAIVISSALFVLIAIIGLSSIRFSHYPLGWFPKDNSIRVATEKIDQELRGSISLEVIIDTGQENGLYEPALLNRLESAAAHVETLVYEDMYVGKAWSLTTVLKEIHQALNENRAEFYRIPQDRNLVAQEFLLFEKSGSDDLEDFVDSQFSKVRFMIKVPFKDAYRAGLFIDEVNRYFEQQFPEATVVLTGMIGLLSRTIKAAIRSMAKSYATALVVITLLMIVLIGRIRIGLLSMIPNLAPIFLMLGVIGFFNLPMDLFTMMVASIAIGLAVDDTIHFMHNFRRYYDHSGDPILAVHQTLQTSGRAMLVTTVVLSAGFFIFAFATMSNVRNFGLLTGFTVVMALLADDLLAPALMVLANKKTTSVHAVNHPNEIDTLPEMKNHWRIKMRTTFVFGLIMTILTAGTVVDNPVLAADDPEARAIMERVDNRDDGDNQTADMQMILIDKNDQKRVRKIATFRKDKGEDTYRLMFFLHPADVKDAAFLTYDYDQSQKDDDQWLYLPALRKTKRIATSDKSGSFMGSDLNYSDMTSRDLEDYDYRFYEKGKQSKVRDKKVWVIWSTPRSKEVIDETGYQKSLLFVRPDIDMVVRAIHWVKEGGYLKYVDRRKLEQIDGIWVASDTLVTKKKGKSTVHKTILTLENIRFNQRLDYELFTIQCMEKGLLRFFSDEIAGC
jgi:predicted RND superfamily exporter protein